MRTILVLIVLLLAALVLPVSAQDADPARQIHLLQYIAVDYSEAVRDGVVINAEEYAEMAEFAAIVAEESGRLPATISQDQLIADAKQLMVLVEDKAAVSAVAEQAEQIRQGILAAYDVLPVPAATPDPIQGQALYREQCATCHGVDGLGDGPAAAGLEPAPSNFHDQGRSDQLDVLAYFNTIRYGVDGTAMASYVHIDEQSRWNVSFYLASLAAQAGVAERGAVIWSENGGGERFPDLASVIQAAPNSLSNDNDKALLTYLRANPVVMNEGGDHTLAIARRLLSQSLAHYLDGDAVGAQRLAVAAYLDGYELVETALAGRDSDFALAMEKDMLAFRGLLRGGADKVTVRTAHEALQSGLQEAEVLLKQDNGDGFWLGLIGALIVLLREGLEAILVVAAILAFVRRVEGGSAKPIHLGWISALAAGFLTWLLAAYVINISGAARELSEGGAALLAAVVLFYMGFWLHDKSHAARWQSYLQQHMDGALATGSRYGLGALAFIAVYREAFETILFMQTLWLQSSPSGQAGLLTGSLVAVFALLVLAWLILRLSTRLPIGQFFIASAVLMYVLAIIFAGKGIMALQEADILPISAINIPRIDWLGIYPSLQSISAQVAMLLILVYLLWIRPRFKANS